MAKNNLQEIADGRFVNRNNVIETAIVPSADSCDVVVLPTKSSPIDSGQIRRGSTAVVQFSIDNTTNSDSTILIGSQAGLPNGDKVFGIGGEITGTFALNELGVKDEIAGAIPTVESFNKMAQAGGFLIGKMTVFTSDVTQRQNRAKSLVLNANRSTKTTKMHLVEDNKDLNNVVVFNCLTAFDMYNGILYTVNKGVKIEIELEVTAQGGSTPNYTTSMPL